MNQMMRRRVHRFVLVAGMAAALACAAPARAQADYYDRYMFPLRISDADFRRMVEKLPANTPAAVAAAYERFADDYAHAVKIIRDRRKRAERNNDDTDAVNLGLDWWDKRLELESRLADDVAEMLETDEQRNAWNRAVADERRRYVLAEMKIDQRLREPFDPVAALDSIELTPDEETRVQPHINVCVEALDRALRSWQRGHLDGLRRRTNTPYESAAGPAVWKEVTEKWRSMNAVVAGAAEDSAKAIADALDPEHRGSFLEGIDRQVYPEAFERCPAELFVDALRVTPDVASEKRTALESIYADYIPIRDQIRRQAVDATRRFHSGDHPLKKQYDELWEAANRGEIGVEERNRRVTELGNQHPANVLLQRRHDLAIETVKRMRAIFSSDEIERMPLAARLALTAW